jgi:type I restriction enzyme M protein
MNVEQRKQLEIDLWSAADNLRANTGLKSSEYATPVLGLIFLKFADNKYRHAEPDILAEHKRLQGGRRDTKPLDEIAREKCGFYLPAEARYAHLLNLPEIEDIAKAIKQAMVSIEQSMPALDGVLPKDAYHTLDKTVLVDLLKSFSNIPLDANGDVFGKIYEFFLGKFALSEGQKGGEFFTPTSVVKLMVEMIEPHYGSVYDPACGSGGMFVQSQHFIERRRAALKKAGKRDSGDQLFVSGQEKNLESVKLAKMNLAVNGLKGEIHCVNSYSDNPFDGFGKFDFVMANPPFNVDDVPVATVENDSRFNTYGIPRNKTKLKQVDKGKETVPNANYLWISLFATSLKDKGRAALVMANSASDARHSESEMRQKLVDNNLIYAMLTLPSNMFYTVTLPATLWFFDKAKANKQILFIDARNIFTQIDRAHREFTEAQIQNIAIISKLHKGERGEFVGLIDGYFSDGMARLTENQQQVEPVSAQLLAVLAEEQGKQAVQDLLAQWQGLAALEQAYQDYVEHTEDMAGDDAALDTMNALQHELRATFDPFFVGLHAGLKKLDKVIRTHEKARSEAAKAEGKRAGTDRETKQLKAALEQLHKEVSSAEGYFQHIHWLQERFPAARYEDVTGLCKLASPAEVQEQDYSLNPGRYVGVVIEEDGKTEEEFLADLTAMNDELASLDIQANALSILIRSNMATVIGDI